MNIYMYIYIYYLKSCMSVCIYITQNCNGFGKSTFLNVLLPKPSLWLNREFTNGLGDRDSIPVESYQRLKKWYLMPPCLTPSIQKQIKGKWSNPWKWVAPLPIPQCSSYWQRSLWVTLNNSWPTYNLHFQNNKKCYKDSWSPSAATYR